MMLMLIVVMMGMMVVVIMMLAEIMVNGVRCQYCIKADLYGHIVVILPRPSIIQSKLISPLAYASHK